MKKSLMMIVSITAVCFGCELSAPPNLGQNCPEAQYYADSNGDEAGRFDVVDDGYYQFFNDYHACPPDYSVCAKDTDGKSYCHPECQVKGDVFCGLGSRCINPLTDKNHCGAKGMCSSTTKSDDNWKGEECPVNSECSGGICQCYTHYHMENGSCKYYEFDPEHCGDYDTKCLKGELCDIDGDTAQCSKNCSKTTCGTGDTKVCIDPNTNPQYCGADPDTCEGFVTCNEYQNCISGNCECKEGYTKDPKTGSCRPVCSANQHIYNDRCEDNDIKNCGSHGAECSTSQVENSTTVSCISGRCVATQCASGYHENNGECLSDTCTKGETKCTTDQTGVGYLNTCNGTSWKVEKCNNVSCNSDRSNCGICLNSTPQKCQDDRVEQCVNGSWQSENCPTGYVCDSEGEKCIEQVEITCTPGETSCTNNPITKTGEEKICKSDGTWPDQAQSCANEASCNGNKCGDCNNDKCTEELKGSILSKCVNGAFSDPEVCPDGQHCNSKGTGCEPVSIAECTDGSYCTNNLDGIGQLRICSGGKWGAYSVCIENDQEVSCNGNKCGDCKNDKCTEELKGSILSKCVNGAFSDPEVCPDGQHCNSEGTGCEAGCTNGEHRCNNLDYQECQNNEWITEATCTGKEETCNSESGCIPDCGLSQTYNGAKCCDNKKYAKVINDSSDECHYKCKTGNYPTAKDWTDPQCKACDVFGDKNSCCADEQYGCCPPEPDQNPDKYNCKHNFSSCCEDKSFCNGGESACSIIVH